MVKAAVTMSVMAVEAVAVVALAMTVAAAVEAEVAWAVAVKAAVTVRVVAVEAVAVVALAVAATMPDLPTTPAPPAKRHPKPQPFPVVHTALSPMRRHVLNGGLRRRRRHGLG